MASRRRYFAGSVALGRLYVQGMVEKKGWDSARLLYWYEEHVNGMLNRRLGDCKIDTEEELQSLLEETRTIGPLFVKVWLHETLEDAVRREWMRSRPSRELAGSARTALVG